jgi:hypothetical protein
MSKSVIVLSIAVLIASGPSSGLVPLELTSFRPDHAYPEDGVSVRVYGYPLLEDLTLSVHSPDSGERFFPKETFVWEPDSAEAVFDLSAAPAGKLDIVVVNPTGDVATIAGLLTILGYQVLEVPGDYPSIQEAVDAAVDGATIEVGPGIYNESVDFRGKALRLVSTSGPETTIITAEGLHARAVDIQEACGSFSELGGFAITKGSVIGSGAGIRCRAPALIRGCIIEGNDARHGEDIYPSGGGIYGANGARIIGNVIRNNKAYGWRCQGDCSGAECRYSIGAGGGIYCFDCLVERNVIEANASAAAAGVYVHWGILRGNLIRGNEGILEDCDLWADAGGASAFESIVEGNQFLGNEALNGSELAVVHRCVVRRNLIAPAEGFGSVTFSAESPALVERNTIVGHVIFSAQGPIHWVGNIFSGAEVGGDIGLPTSAEGPAQARSDGAYPPAPAPGAGRAAVGDRDLPAADLPGRLAGNILVRGARVTGILEDVFPDWADSNATIDPLFCDAEAGDFRLTPWSPALPEFNPLAWPDTVGAFGVGCAVVPVLLWGLEALREGDAVRLEWFLSSDVDYEGLAITREELATAERTVLTPEPIPPCDRCSYTDADPPGGEIRYRILAVLAGEGERILGEVEVGRAARPAAPFISPARPNPSPGAVSFTASAPAGWPLAISVYDAAGRRVRTLVDDAGAEETRTVLWDGTDARGRSVASGIYYVVMAQPRRLERKVLIMR